MTSLLNTQILCDIKPYHLENRYRRFGGTSFQLQGLPVQKRYQAIKVVKVKVQFTLEQATEAQRGSRGIALLFL
jgi:hypothetical protein